MFRVYRRLDGHQLATLCVWGGGGSPGIFSAASGTTSYVLQWRNTSYDVEAANKKENLMSDER
jgi:hypothetical protein